MLGEMLGELNGNIIGKRVVSGYHMGGPLKIESTMESKGKILGQEVTFIATFWRMDRPQGGMFSMGQGVLMTRDGGKAILRGAGVSVPPKGPGWSMRGSRYAQTAVPGLKRLNEVAIVFEIEIAPDMTVKDRWWEWK
ncbi:MAG TPA: hypothetical protein VLV30_08220 [Methanomicrobiales archaeon]|nr:hypothetical protein [Methanomicrobiales archaeon]